MTRITMCTIVAEIPKIALLDILDMFKPSSTCPCAYHFASRTSDIILKGDIPEGIEPKIFPGNVTICYQNGESRGRIFKFKIFKTGTIHYAGGMNPTVAFLAMHDIAHAISIELVNEPRIIMINAVDHIGDAIHLYNLERWVSRHEIPYAYHAELHSGFRFFVFSTDNYRCACDNKYCEIESKSLKKKKKLVCKRTIIMLQPTGAVQILAAPSEKCMIRAYTYVQSLVAKYLGENKVKND